MNKPTFSERLSDHVASFFGSWFFIIISTISILTWMAFNILTLNPWDAPPFIGLNLLLSCVAAFQAPVVLLSSNRQSQIDRERDDQDFVTDQLTNQEVREINKKLDLLLKDKL